jgi:5-carboxymethyl-2-hydroxymuconate isomerase
MPHITLEYTYNIDQSIEFRALFAELHQMLASVAGVSIDNCKSRAICLDTYHIGDGEAQNAFVHLEIQLLEGRSAELKQEIGARGLQVLKRYFAGSLGKLDLQITLEVRDMQRQAYFKAVLE